MSEDDIDQIISEFRHDRSFTVGTTRALARLIHEVEKLWVECGGLQAEIIRLQDALADE